MKKSVKYAVGLLFMLMFNSCLLKASSYQDLKHYSRVFGKEKTYRLYLPDNYLGTDKKYPVIYFFHGWGGRYFKDDSAKLEYEKIGELVNKYQVVLVMWDGNMDEKEPRPYNIGDHRDVKFGIQMKDYFPELVSHIDSTYRVLKDRGHRGIIGFSMGGIMSFYLAGKYPDQISAAVNMVGSPEFFIGLPDNHTLYQVRYTFDNLRDVGLLFHNREMCPMLGLNDEVNNAAIWNEMTNYEFHKLQGNHKVDDPGETKVFESAMRFVVSKFDKPVPLYKTWSHYDLCPEFNLWGYLVKSNKNEPGYLLLRNVDVNGFGFYSLKWLPDGPVIKNCKSTVSTAPIYEPGIMYEIRIWDQKVKLVSLLNIRADKDGRLQIDLSGNGCEVGISRKGQRSGFSVSGYKLDKNRKFLQINEHNELSVSIFNRGKLIEASEKLSVTLSCTDSSVTISSPTQKISVGEGIFQTKPFKIFSKKTPPSDGSPEWLRIQVRMDNGIAHSEDHFILPVFYDVPYFQNIRVDDGRAVASTRNQGDYSRTVADLAYGTGNADGIASPGEQIMLYENDHRLRLYTEDPYVITGDEKLIDEILPAVWPDGFTLSSVVKIAENCPVGHEIEFLAHYETKTQNPIHRQVEWGKVKIKIGIKT